MVDVRIIGGGPAGSAAAIRLAQAGKRVQLFEKARFPRPKLCGGFLSPESLSELDELGVLEALRAAGATPVRRTLISSPAGFQVETSLPGVGLSISREDLDRILLQRARDAGVEVREATDGFTAVSEAAWTIVAAGRKVDAGSYYGIQAFFEDVDGVTDQVELDLVPGGYVGLVRQGPRVNVCALALQNILRTEGPVLDEVLVSWMGQNALLRKRLRSARRFTSWQAVGPVRMGLRALTAPSRLFIGDAACVVDPFVGEGIAMGLRGATLAGRAFTQTQMPIETAYERAWHREFDSALRAGARLRRLMRAPFIQNLSVAALQMFPAALTWLTERTRPNIHADFDPRPTRDAV